MLAQGVRSGKITPMTSDLTLLKNFADPTATHQFADACWRQRPTLSPNSWRVWEGLTLAKVAQLISHATTPEECAERLQAGLNLLVVPSPVQETGLAVVTQALQAAQIERTACVLVAVVPWQEGATLATLAPMLTWQPDVVVFEGVTPEQWPLAAELGEQLAYEGMVGCYGLASETWGLPETESARLDLAVCHDQAREAAAKVWGRRKRSLFRWLGIPLNLLEWQTVTLANTQARVLDGVEMVSVLELAARMHMGVLALRPLVAWVQGQGVLLTEANPNTAGLVPLVHQQAHGVWQQAPLAALGLNVVASTPGITAAVCDFPPGVSLATIYTVWDHGDIVDIAPFAEAVA